MESKKSQIEKSSRPIVYDLSNQQCVWSKAGVLEPRLCVNAFDCTSCPVDKMVQKNLAAGKLTDLHGQPAVSFRHPDHWLRLPQNQRQCRHMLSGRVPVKFCSNSFNCAACEYDQMIEAEDINHPVFDPAIDMISGFALARDYYYFRGHTWARVEYGGMVRIGLDDFARRLLGPLDEISLPKLGDTVVWGEPGLRVKREGQEAEMLSPIEGIVIASNPRVSEDGRTVHRSPYGDGWLLVVRPTKLRRNLKSLLFGEECPPWIDEEAGRLVSMVVEETGHRLAATGGEAIEDIYGTMPKLGWRKLVSEFLLT